MRREMLSSSHRRMVEDGVDVWSLARLRDHQPTHHLLHVARVHPGEGRKLSLHHFESQLLHRSRLEGHRERAHLEEDASQGPHVRVERVGAVAPHLGGHVVRRADLGVGHRTFHQLRDAQVAEFHHLAGHAKHVRRLDVAVQDLLRVKRLETARNLDEVAPDEVLGKELALRLALAQGAGEIAEGGVLHHDAQTVAVDERLVEAADGGVLLHRREQADLIHSLLALLLREVAHVGLLQRVHLVVAQASYAIATRGEDEMNGGGEGARQRSAEIRGRVGLGGRFFAGRAVVVPPTRPTPSRRAPVPSGRDADAKHACDDVKYIDIAKRDRSRRRWTVATRDARVDRPLLAWCRHGKRPTHRTSRRAGSALAGRARRTLNRSYPCRGTSAPQSA